MGIENSDSSASYSGPTAYEMRQRLGLHKERDETRAGRDPDLCEAIIAQLRAESAEFLEGANELVKDYNKLVRDYNELERDYNGLVGYYDELEEAAFDEIAHLRSLLEEAGVSLDPFDGALKALGIDKDVLESQTDPVKFIRDVWVKLVRAFSTDQHSAVLSEELKRLATRRMQDINMARDLLNAHFDPKK